MQDAECTAGPAAQPFVPDPATAARLHAADLFAYASMFDAAGPRLGAGRALVDGAMAMWNPHDESCGYNCLIAFEAAPDPEATWQTGLAAARAGGARVFGVGVTPERAAWATPDKLAEHGLTWEYEEIVWARWLDERDGPLPPPTLPAGVAFRSDPADLAADRELYGRVLNRGWDEPEEHGRGHLYAAAIGLPGWTHYLAYVDGLPAGAGALCAHQGVALCMVTATDPTFRGRGIQSALIGRRLSEAVAAGCDLAATETVDENASPRNFQRAGFRFVTRRQMYRTET
jgi:GNAT superfamily N-acetyltransferase